MEPGMERSTGERAQLTTATEMENPNGDSTDVPTSPSSAGPSDVQNDDDENNKTWAEFFHDLDANNLGVDLSGEGNTKDIKIVDENRYGKSGDPMHSQQRPYWDGIPADQALYSNKYEGEACGVGAICNFKSKASREIVEAGKEMLIRMTHRGATTRPMDGDGAGILCSIPDRFFREMTYRDFVLPPAGEYGVGIIFMPRTEEKRHDCRVLIKKVAKKLGLSVLGYRQVPTDSTHLGQYAAFTEPHMSQIFVALDEDYFERNQMTLDTASVYSVGHTHARQISATRRPGIDAIFEDGGSHSVKDDDEITSAPSPRGPMAADMDRANSFRSMRGQNNRLRTLSAASSNTRADHAEKCRLLELKLFLLRRLVSLRGKELYFCSLSNNIIVYKGQLVPEQLFRFFEDLEDPRFTCHLIVVHSRFSTNSFPSWSRAHPHRVLAHNGEINTFQGNVNWIRAREAAMEAYGSDILAKTGFSSRHLFPMNEDVGSDSSFLDNVVELLTACSGRDIAEVMLMLIPEAWQNDPTLTPERRAFYEYQACAMEPWDGPALVIFTDGHQLGATLDRNGLRPGRYYITQDDRLILASEVGVVDVDPQLIVSKGRLQPGKILLVDFDEQRVLPDTELKEKYANKYDYVDWLRNVPHVSKHLEKSTEKSNNLTLISDARIVEELLTSSEDSDLGPTPTGQHGATASSLDKNQQLRTVDSHSSFASEAAAEKQWSSMEIPYLTLFGYTHEKVEMILGPMALSGAEALGSMGNDAPLACLSRLPRSPFDYFYQLFAQATNPAIDPLREANVMSLECPIGPEGNLLQVSPQSVRHRCFLDEPVLDPERFRVLQKMPCLESYAVLDLTYSSTSTHDVGRQQWNQKAFENDTVLELRLAQLCNEAEAAIKIDGVSMLVLSHRLTSPETIPIASLLAVGILNQFLVERKLRSEVAIVVEGGDCFEIHHFALLLGYGADAVFPYMAYLALQRCRRPKYTQDFSLATKIENYRRAVHQGLLKVMSKCGISCLQSYKGAQLFQAIGISNKVVNKCFTGTDVALQGVGFDIFHLDAVRLHTIAFQQMRLPPLVDEESRELPDWGEYHFRSVGEQNEFHMNSPDVIAKLQQAAKTNSTKAFRTYEEYQDKISEQGEVRGQLEFAYHEDGPLDLAEIEPASEIVKRFVTGAVSLGSISEEAHKALALSMNRAGSRSNTGEGGEESERFTALKHSGLIKAGAVDWEVEKNDSFRSKIKQVASGRFGVTTQYLVNADELQIKLSQGAKPGEGGELPGYKVIGKIAEVRQSTPGVGLISPPPHHDMYSIEDVAQLISDLKHVNPEARISVKLVSRVGVGIIASGIVKGKAQHVTISGGNGGTGAAKWTSIKRTGLPWEIGLAETHQTLNLNGIRQNVCLQTDGQIRTARDILVAFLLGADEVAMTTAPLITLGCIMMRKCHLNTCPVGVATQDPELRAKFDGHPEHLINYLFLLANEVRRYMAQLRVTSVKELIGRADLLRPRPATFQNRKTAQLDFEALLTPAWTMNSLVMQDQAPQLHQETIDRRGSPAAAVRRGTRRAPGNYICCGGSATADALDHFLVSNCKPLKEFQPAQSFGQTHIHQAERRIRPLTISLVRITNEHRTVGAMLSYMVCRFQETFNENKALAADTIRVQFQGHAGQSFAAFLITGITFELEGDANDGCAKGLSGGRVIVYPPQMCSLVPHENILIGNAALYGATGGQAFFSGVASERFCIRNSGAVAVVEGVGDHGCEYMTRGLVLILGKTGTNFAAGMSGGIAFVLDLNPQNVNSQTVFVESITEEDQHTIRNLLEEHTELTNSQIGAELLALPPKQLAPRFSRIFPKEYKKVLKEAIVEHTKVGSKLAAKILDEFDKMRNPLPHKRTDLFSSAYLQHLKPSTAYGQAGIRRSVAGSIGLPIGGPLREVGGVGVVKSSLSALGLGTVTENRAVISGEYDSLVSADDPAARFRLGYSLWRKSPAPGGKDSKPGGGKVHLPKEERENLLNGPKWRRIERKLRGEETPSTAASCDSNDGSQNENEPIKDDMNDSLQLDNITLLPQGSNSVPGIADSSAGGGTRRASTSSVNLALVAKSSSAAGINKVDKLDHHRDSTDSLEFLQKKEKPTKKKYLQIISDVEDIMRGSHLRAVAVSVPTKRKGFHLYGRKTAGYRDPKDRLLDSEEIYAGGKVTASTRARNLVRTQASRCMNCGTPTCQFPNQGGGGCPLANRIPVWNSLVHEEDWKRALERLLDTNNFPEFTGTTCPAPCEEACVLGINEGPVTIKSIENAIIEKGFQMGWVSPKPPVFRTKKKVVVVGSGPCGLAAAQQLNRAGHQVTVLEREDQFGGLLFYGIPNMKLEKRKVVRRIDLMRQEGITFHANVEVGTTVNYDLQTLCSEYDAVLFSTGANAARKLERSLPGNDLGNIVQAMDFLTDSQRYESQLAGVNTDPHSLPAAVLSISTNSSATGANRPGKQQASGPSKKFDCADKDIIVIGGGDTAVDVIGTAIRQGAKSITQFSRRPKASEDRPVHTPWPSWADVYRTDYAHEEYIAATGSDPRTYAIKTREFVPDRTGKVVKKVVALQDVLDADGNKTGEERLVEYDADYVFLAMGFVGSEKIKCPAQSAVSQLRPNQLFEQEESLNSSASSLPAVSTPQTRSANGHQISTSGVTTLAQLSTNNPNRKEEPVETEQQDHYYLGSNVFFAGDCRRGASLVVTAIAEGRDVANRIDEYLLAKDCLRGDYSGLKYGDAALFNRGLSALPRCIPLAQNPALYTRSDVLESNEQIYRKKKKMKKPQISDGFERGFLLQDDPANGLDKEGNESKQTTPQGSPRALAITDRARSAESASSLTAVLPPLVEQTTSQADDSTSLLSSKVRPVKAVQIQLNPVVSPTTLAEKEEVNEDLEKSRPKKRKRHKKKHNDRNKDPDASDSDSSSSSDSEEEKGRHKGRKRNKHRDADRRADEQKIQNMLMVGIGISVVSNIALAGLLAFVSLRSTRR
ncbi:unnamed protein product [Amoebophrya sp. A120]|nr:unnamed protein product [Amoebophrya sp. A120]|eukprot:GSA120T00005320001.1